MSEKAGRWRDRLSPELREAYDRMRAGGPTTALDEAILLLDIRIGDVVAGLGVEAGKETWDELLGLFERRRQLAATETRRVQALRKAVPIEEIAAWKGAVAAAIRNQVKDDDTLKALREELDNIDDPAGAGDAA